MATIRVYGRVDSREWSRAYARMVAGKHIIFSHKINERQRLFRTFSLRFYVTVCLLTSLLPHRIFAEETGIVTIQESDNFPYGETLNALSTKH